MMLTQGSNPATGVLIAWNDMISVSVGVAVSGTGVSVEVGGLVAVFVKVGVMVGV